MSEARRLHHTYAQYLMVERETGKKHEFWDGEIYAMAGGTPEHARLAARILALLETRLTAPCRAFSPDLKIRVQATGLSTYPDVSVICGKLARAEIDENAVENPTLLVEVTSPSTEDYDRGEKLRHYLLIPTVRAVLIVSHREPRVTLVRVTERGADTRDFVAGETVTLEEPAVAFTVNELYESLEGL